MLLCYVVVVVPMSMLLWWKCKVDTHVTCWMRRGFTQGSKTKEISKLSHPIGREHDLWSKEFTLGFGFQLWEEQMNTCWRCIIFPSKSCLSPLEKILLLVWETSAQAWGPILSSKVRYTYVVFWAPSFLDMDLDGKPDLSRIRYVGLRRRAD